MIGKHEWQAQILDVIPYVLLQQPSDLDEVTRRENANLSTIKTDSIVQGVLAQGSARTLIARNQCCATTNKQKNS